jgi:HlyD family secretion protein
MHEKAKRGVWAWRRIVMTSVCASLLLGALVLAWMKGHARKPALERYLTTDVRRADLFPTVTATGRVESAKRTVIECELENIAIGVRGQRLDAGGASVLLSVIPEGSLVKRGDILAVLDSADYEEMLRVQRITVERAAADKVQAELQVEITRLAVREFEQGTLGETNDDFEGRILLARSELERTTDRVAWCHRMKAKGYLPATAVSAEEFKQMQLDLALAQQRSAYELFKNYTAPKTSKVLRGAVTAAETTLEYQRMRLRRQRDRLALLEEQVKNCTIRAPHDGFVIYANNSDRQVFIEAGVPVRQRQQLFYLPDLTDMEVVTMLHESIVDEIAPDMRARVQVEGINHRPIEGHVTSVAPMSSFSWRSDVTYFQGIVHLDDVPSGLKPGMTAEVELAMPRRDNVLAVPSEAIWTENGRDVCFIVHDDGLERREVKIGQVTRDLAEVTAGLEEGEQIALNPVRDDVISEAPLAHSDPNDREPTSPSGHPAGVVAALQ